MISEETAQEQLKQLLDYYDIDPEDFLDINLDDKDNSAKVAYDRLIRKLTKGIIKGKMEITIEENRPFIIQHLDKEMRGQSEIKYKPITGNAKMEMDKYKEDTGKLYGLLGVLSGTSKVTIQGLEGYDLSLAEYIGAFFLLV